MVKSIFFIMVMLSLLMAGQAMALEEVVKTDSCKFSIDVPDTWTLKNISEGCIISSDDHRNYMTFQLVESTLSLQDLAQKSASSMGINSKKNNIVQEDKYIVEGDINGISFVVLTFKYKNHLILSIWGGNDRDAMDKIFKSINVIPEIDLQAGPIYSNEHAKKRCPEVLNIWLKKNPGRNAEWNGNWETTIPGEMSICTIRVKD